MTANRREVLKGGLAALGFMALDGLPVYKLHCSVLAEEAIQAALKDYEERKKKQNAEDKPDSE